MFGLFKKRFISSKQPRSLLYEQLLGGVMGFAVGDALGVPVEFKKRDSYTPIVEMIGFGTHNQPVGTWSDDTSMTLCLIENLIHGYNCEQLKQIFVKWYYYGHWTPDGKLPFDMGASTFKVLSRIKSGVLAHEAETGAAGEMSNGNGSLMRVLPLAFYLKDINEKEKFSIIEEVSGITHAHIRSKLACSLYVEIAIHLLKGLTPLDSYQKAKWSMYEHYKERVAMNEFDCFHRILKDDISEYPRDQIKSTGYVIDTLEASLWCFLKGHSFEDTVLLAVNLGEDTDTIGALSGGLAGIYYGLQNIPPKWVNRLARHDEIQDLCLLFYNQLSTQAPSST
ncbi:ADP-ribosylglycohydrolase [Paenibacillus sp. 1182]|uniref:ADP-ribosylglycohydrolase family protein n=1 Tax=Paenibacillus sp. 1182 TaxID=2806565 RepID=UPI001AE29F1C|nr:ADP-ribosylglycohydrolase family protein [Paenibacillus sp. 1182]MBP1309139.1 ADP-ribosylglycohydrolase [Paenibacillus sp. 1182]